MQDIEKGVGRNGNDCCGYGSDWDDMERVTAGFWHEGSKATFLYEAFD